MRLAVFGDSFGYQNPDQPFQSWVDHLGQHYQVFNYCECGVGQYKILQQLRQNLESHDFDRVIITHTSATRTFVPHNPLHQHSKTHKNCDIIYADVADRNDDFSQACQQFFRFIFDIDYSLDIHNMICREIHDMCANHNVIHITHFDYTGLYQFPDMINFYQLWCKNKGSVNHYNQSANQLIFQTLLEKLQLIHSI